MSGTRGEGLRRIEKEIAGEKAAALGRAGERLEQALAETRRVGAHLQRVTDAAERERLTQAYVSARQIAECLFDVRLMIDRTLAVYAAATARAGRAVR